MLVRHLWQFLWTGEGLSLMFRLRAYLVVGSMLAYTVLPFDLMPGERETMRDSYV